MDLMGNNNQQRVVVRKEKGGGGDASVPKPVVEGVEGEGDGVAKVKELDGMIEEVDDRTGGGSNGWWAKTPCRQ